MIYSWYLTESSMLQGANIDVDSFNPILLYARKLTQLIDGCSLIMRFDKEIASSLHKSPFHLSPVFHHWFFHPQYDRKLNPM